MIDKIRFGKRLSALRSKTGFSQTELACRLGVTSQAVSKWEYGNALPDIELLLSLSHLFGVTINEMLEGREILSELTGIPLQPDTVACFVPEEERDYNAAWAEEIVHEGYVKRNWTLAQSANALDETGKVIASKGGVILEIGAGPGGGFMPFILKANPDATVIINDLSPTVVKEWKRFFDKNAAYQNLHYAVFDFCHMPFRDNSIDTISDGGGIGNCEGNKSEALKECFRILKPGGCLVTSTGFVNRETLLQLPEEARIVLMEKRPDIFKDLYEETVLAGFTKIDSVISGCWHTDDDESAIADLARSLGVNLKFTSYIRYCTKE